MIAAYQASQKITYPAGDEGRALDLSGNISAAMSSRPTTHLSVPAAGSIQLMVRVSMAPSMHQYFAEHHFALCAYSSCRRSQKGESASSRPLGARSRIG